MKTFCNGQWKKKEKYTKIYTDFVKYQKKLFKNYDKKIPFIIAIKNINDYVTDLLRKLYDLNAKPYRGAKENILYIGTYRPCS